MPCTFFLDLAVPEGGNLSEQGFLGGFPDEDRALPGTSEGWLVVIQGWPVTGRASLGPGQGWPCTGQNRRSMGQNRPGIEQSRAGVC